MKSCGICYNELTKQTGKCSLSCSHEFHFSCFSQCTDGTCPTCRSQLSDYERPSRIHLQSSLSQTQSQSQSQSQSLDSNTEGSAFDSLCSDEDTEDLNNMLYGVTPLMKAVSNNDLITVHDLLEDNEININAKDSEGDTALVYAVLHQNNGAVQLLVQAGADIEPLLSLLTTNPTTNVNTLVFGKQKHHLTKSILLYSSALMVACLYKIPFLVKYCLDRGANPNFKHPITGATTLMIAVNIGDRTLVQLLLRYGANVLCMDAKGWNVFMWNAKNSNIMKDLLTELVSSAVRPTKRVDSLRHALNVWKRKRVSVGSAPSVIEPTTPSVSQSSGRGGGGGIVDPGSVTSLTASASLSVSVD